MGLTETGLMQARSAAALVSVMQIKRIYTSPMERARQTADIVGEYGSIKVISDDRLIELDMGKFTGMRYDEIFSLHGNVFLKFYSGDLALAHNGVETFESVKRRVFSMVEELQDRHQGENILLVTHMDPIKAVLSKVMDLTPQTLFELILANASMTVFNAMEGGLSLMGINIMDSSRFLHTW